MEHTHTPISCAAPRSLWPPARLTHPRPMRTSRFRSSGVIADLSGCNHMPSTGGPAAHTHIANWSHLFSQLALIGSHFAKGCSEKSWKPTGSGDNVIPDPFIARPAQRGDGLCVIHLVSTPQGQTAQTGLSPSCCACDTVHGGCACIDQGALCGCGLLRGQASGVGAACGRPDRHRCQEGELLVAHHGRTQGIFTHMQQDGRRE